MKIILSAHSTTLDFKGLVQQQWLFPVVYFDQQQLLCSPFDSLMTLGNHISSLFTAFYILCLLFCIGLWLRFYVCDFVFVFVFEFWLELELFFWLFLSSSFCHPADLCHSNLDSSYSPSCVWYGVCMCVFQTMAYKYRYKCVYIYIPSQKQSHRQKS